MSQVNKKSARQQIQKNISSYTKKENFDINDISMTSLQILPTQKKMAEYFDINDISMTSLLNLKSMNTPWDE